MSGRRAILNLSSRSVSSDDVAAAGVEVWDAAAVRGAFAPQALSSVLGRFEAVDILVDDRRSLLSIKPQLAARLMARGRCRVIDHAGAEPLAWGKLAAMGLRSARDAMLLPRLRRAVDLRMETLEGPAPEPGLGEGPPLYLRADLWYGVRAGGSIGHIAGVLKGLAGSGWPAVLASPEAIPTVPPATRLMQIAPPRRQLFQAEWQQLIFNLDLVDQIVGAWSGPPPRFVYQRHGLNLFGGLDLARQWGVPFVLEYNGPEVWVAENWGRPPAERGRARRAEDVAVRGADLVVVVSDVLATAVRDKGVPDHRILILPNAVDPVMFTPERDGKALRAEHGLGDETVIGFIGTFGPWHGAEVLVDAFAELLRRPCAKTDRLRLMLVGDGVRMGAVKARIAVHGIGDRTVLTGLLPQGRGPDAVGAFDIAVAPTVGNADGSPFFGSPTKLFEYMAAGKASVCSGIGQVNDVIENGMTGLIVPPGDVLALRDALATLVDQPELRRRLGTRAREVAVAQHTYAARARILLDALGRWDRRGEPSLGSIGPAGLLA